MVRPHHCFPALILAAILAPIHNANAQLFAEPIATGFTNPILVTAPEGDPRLFVVEQPGLIHIIEDGSILPTPFLNIASIVAFGGERGLLGLAFHPQYDQNGFFYVHYSNARTGQVGDTVVSRFTVSPDPNVADPNSELILLEEPQPQTNHNGGMIAFQPGDPNHFLYIALGDGGGAGDTANRAQNTDLRLGKILRIDVDQETPETPAAGNPFIGMPGNDFIWAYGLRNPWRFSFDRQTGDMYIGDVGQGAVEEVNFQPAASTGGENYGWRLLEGSADFNCADCDAARMNTVLPIHEYTHADGNTVIGGYVYRGALISGLQGTYFFGDLSGRIWSFRYDGANLTEFAEHTSILPTPQTIVSFGQDGDGELYVIGHGGDIHQIKSQGTQEVVSISGAGIHQAGTNVTLSVTIAGTIGNVTYEWFKDGGPTPLANQGNISGADTPNLAFTPIQLTDSGTYVLQFTDESKATFTAPPIHVAVGAQLPALGILALGLLTGALTTAATLTLNRRRRHPNIA